MLVCASLRGLSSSSNQLLVHIRDARPYPSGGRHEAETRTIQRSQRQTCSPGQLSCGESHTPQGSSVPPPVHLTGLLFLHPEMGAPESVRSTERPSLKSMPFQPGQQKHTSQCDVSKAKNTSPNFPNFFIWATTAQVSYRVLGRSLPQDPGQSQGWRRYGGCMIKQWTKYSFA